MQNNRDIFVEELIRCNRAGKEGAFKVAAVILGLILCGLAFHYFTSIFPFFFGIICILIFLMLDTVFRNMSIRSSAAMLILT